MSSTQRDLPQGWSSSLWPVAADSGVLPAGNAPSRGLRGSPRTREDELHFLHAEGTLLQARGSIFGEQVFFCLRGRRHSVLSAARLEELGFRWPADVVAVPERVLASFAAAGHLPGLWHGSVDTSRISDSTTMREAMAAGLAGGGLEVGAGASPFPVPLACRVLYGDRLPHADLLAELYPGQRACDLVIPDILTDFDELDGVADGSQDFLIACHVIEHTRNPIGSIAAAHRKLRPGGTLLLVIPDKQRTFDRHRPLTPLSHLIEDHLRPDRQRDYAHYEEFYRLSFPMQEPAYSQEVRHRFETRHAIHYHVWDHDAFRLMLDWLQDTVVGWSEIWTHPAVGNAQENIELYAVLTK